MVKTSQAFREITGSYIDMLKEKPNIWPHASKGVVNSSPLSNLLASGSVLECEVRN
jgi:hypothetical protein